ncbi:MAG: maleylpyruvate isomerase family mycothiol-dependent enzyme [Lapillicoccus sp.]
MTAADEFTYRRVHACPRDLVFACLTTPAHLAQFWGPTGTHTPLDRIVVDLRPGGVFETTIVSDESGGEHTMRAVYVEVDPPSIVAWREVESGMLTTLTFDDLGDGTTEVVTRQTGVPLAYRAPGARVGWETSLERAADYLRRLANGELDVRSADLQHLVGPQFLALADALDAQPSSVGDRASLCTGWTVRHVIAHLTMAARYDGPAFQAELAAVAYDFQTLSDAIAQRDGALPLDVLLQSLRSETMAQWSPPGGGAAGALSHIVIHSLDITSGVGLPRTASDEATTVVLDGLTTGDVHQRFDTQIQGLRLVASDLDWAFGDGTLIEAEAGDLVLALAGRARPGVTLS